MSKYDLVRGKRLNGNGNGDGRGNGKGDEGVKGFVEPYSDNMGLLSAMEAVVTLSKKSNLSHKFFEEANSYINLVAKKLNITPNQALLLSHFINFYDERRIYAKDISNHINCLNITIIKYLKDIEGLIKLKYLRRGAAHGAGTYYTVPKEVMDAFKEQKPFVPKDLSNLTPLRFFVELNKIFVLRMNDELSYEELDEEINTLLSLNRELTFVKKLEKLKLDREDKLLFIRFCNCYVEHKDDELSEFDYETVFDDDFTLKCISNELESNRHKLFELGLLESAYNEGFGDRYTYKLTDKAKKTYLGELKLSQKSSIDETWLLQYNKLQPKRLFYNKKQQEQVKRLYDLLKHDNFKNVTQRLKESGMRGGFAAIFYGAPGTGKTETVYQIAKECERNIMQVDLSSIKSMWVGESEKNIKKIFNNYREFVAKAEFVPILLFNEADGIFGKRFIGAERAADKMENTIQNIILQEMENLEGILIATTNLTDSLDKAFERRFLYKIEFARPGTDERAKIWHEILPELPLNEAKLLAQRYDFSGGEIENIARRYSVDKILYGASDNISAQISDLCKKERMASNTKSKKIGF